MTSPHDLTSPIHPDAFEIFGAPEAGGAFVFTCEHATHRVSPPLHATAEDWIWLQQHWGWDPGIEDVTQALLKATGSCGVFSRFSRLICDPNRGHDEPSWLPTHIDGHPLALNAALDDAERVHRKQAYYDPYHDAISQLLETRTKTAEEAPFTLLAMHSFTPVYKKEIRPMEIGVVYDETWSSAAALLADALTEEGFVVALNEPYSGMEGMIYSAWRHGNAHQVRYLELELRQDLIGTEALALDVAERMLPALQRFAAQCEAP